MLGKGCGYVVFVDGSKYPMFAVFVPGGFDGANFQVIFVFQSYGQAFKVQLLSFLFGEAKGFGVVGGKLFDVQYFTSEINVLVLEHVSGLVCMDRHPIRYIRRYNCPCRRHRIGTLFAAVCNI